MAAKNGSEVRVAEVFDYHEFAERGGDYLIAIYGHEAAREQIDHCVIADEQARAREFVKSVYIEKEVPDSSSIKRLLDEGYLVVTLVNARSLNRQPGYVGHWVVITGYNDDTIFINDPGGRTTPMQKDREQHQVFFTRAWAYPDGNAKNIIAIRPQQKREA